MAYLGIQLPIYTHLSLHCEHVQLYDMSISKPLVTPVYNGTTLVNMLIFLQNGNVCFEGYC